MKPQPPSNRKPGGGSKAVRTKRNGKNRHGTVKEKLLKGNLPIYHIALIIVSY